MGLVIGDVIGLVAQRENSLRETLRQVGGSLGSFAEQLLELMAPTLERYELSDNL